jgi:hypothetical protein
MPHADERIQQIITESENSEPIIEALREIEYWLRWIPKEFGESRYENVRVGFVSPFGVQFEIIADPPTVIVMNVWLVR